MTEQPDSRISENIACIGAGNVGRSWAIVFARAGYDVRLYDISDASLTQAKTTIKASLDDLKANALIDDVDAAFGRISFTTDLVSAVAKADYVQESIVENTEAKRQIFAALGDTAPPEAILASSTSAIAPSLFADAASGPHRCLVAHPLNPPHVIPVVELCPGPHTDRASVERAQRILRDAGMEPVVLSREIEGFVLNRLQSAVMAEAFNLIGNGVCTPADIETAMTKGLARRWAFLGPFMTGHLNATGGYQDYIDSLGPMFRALADDLDPQQPWTDESIAAIRETMEATIAADQVGEGQAWRDQRLMRLTRHLAEQDDFK